MPGFSHKFRIKQAKFSARQAYSIMFVFRPVFLRFSLLFCSVHLDLPVVDVELNNSNDFDYLRDFCWCMEVELPRRCVCTRSSLLSFADQFFLLKGPEILSF